MSLFPRNNGATPFLVASRSRASLSLSLLIFIFFACSCAGAQQFAFKHYGQDEGLKNLDVFRLLQDKSGFLWAATENGLFRYDGSEFHRFGNAEGLQESLITDAISDASGRVRVATDSH